VGYDTRNGVQPHRDPQKHLLVKTLIHKIGPPVFAQLTLFPTNTQNPTMLSIGQTPSTVPHSRGASAVTGTAGVKKSLLGHPHVIRGSLDSLKSTSKRHLDRFGRFCRAHDRDRQTDKPRYSVFNNRLHLASAATVGGGLIVPVKHSVQELIRR